MTYRIIRKYRPCSLFVGLPNETKLMEYVEDDWNDWLEAVNVYREIVNQSPAHMEYVELRKTYSDATSVTIVHYDINTL